MRHIYGKKKRSVDPRAVLTALRNKARRFVARLLLDPYARSLRRKRSYGRHKLVLLAIELIAELDKYAKNVVMYLALLETEPVKAYKWLTTHKLSASFDSEKTLVVLWKLAAEIHHEERHTVKRGKIKASAKKPPKKPGCCIHRLRKKTRNLAYIFVPG